MAIGFASTTRPSCRAVTGGGREREGSRSNADESVQPSVAEDENKSSASAKLLLRSGVRVFAGAFPLLKSVAGGLCFILDNCEVHPPATYIIQNVYWCRSVRRGISKQ
jgi:hypothetical protein